MRKKELQDGITVFKDNKPIGKSKIAAQHAIGQTAFSRVVAAMPSMVVPPIAMEFIKLNPVPSMIIHAGIVGTCMGIGLPLAIALFDQKASISGSKLEDDFKKYDTLYFNRGL